MLKTYLITCSTCSKPFDLKNLAAHEVMCQQSVCSNELCGVTLTDENVVIDLDESLEQVIQRNLDGNKVRFTIMGEEFVSCSKKCKKVTKFAYMLREKNEQEILRAFESMLRKKAFKKQQSQPAHQPQSSTHQKAVDRYEGLSANRFSLENSAIQI